MELNADLKKIRNLIMWNLPLTLKLNSQCDPSLHSPHEQTQAHGSTQSWTKLSFLWPKGLYVRGKTPMTIKVIYGKYKQHNKWRGNESGAKDSPFLILFLICVLITLICNFYFPITSTYVLIIFIYLFVLNMLGAWLVCRNLCLDGKGSSIHPFPLT